MDIVCTEGQVLIFDKRYFFRRLIHSLLEQPDRSRATTVNNHTTDHLEAQRMILADWTLREGKLIQGAMIRKRGNNRPTRLVKRIPILQILTRRAPASVTAPRNLTKKPDIDLLEPTIL